MTLDTIAARADSNDTLPQAESGSTMRLRLWGPLTAPSAPTIRQLVRHCAETRGATVFVDLRAVSVIDVCGIAALLDGRRVLERGGGAMVLEVNEVVARALRTSGTITAFRMLPECAA